MGESLERDLGLPSVLAISIGAMVGSGIFILPGLAMKMAGSSVVLAYLLAAILVLPAALSKSEMATAMPEAGGTYLYIERGMGSILGTIAGVGTWFSLTFKSGLALIGGAPYIVLLLDLPVQIVAVVIAIILIIVNIVGVKQTGRMQVGIVSIMLLALAWFVISGVPSINTTNYSGFFDKGVNGLLGATGFVFVSYAGVTKVASIAEEIENPDKNIPLGILGSLTFTTILYVAIVAVMVGVVPESNLTSTDVPMAEVAEAVLPSFGVTAIVIAALLALISTANAGLLSSSRYPLAMSRDGLAPESFEVISDRFETPVRSITLTGSVLLFLILFVDIEAIAKLASAFQILVFILINLAVIAFREGNVDEYEPSFKSPLYPATQIFGVIGGLIILPYIGIIPILGAAGITIGSLIWYWAYVYRGESTSRESALTDVVRRKVGKEIVSDTKAEINNPGYEILLAFHRESTIETKRELLTLSTILAKKNNGRVRVELYNELPLQTPLVDTVDIDADMDENTKEMVESYQEEIDVEIVYDKINTHFSGHAIVNRAEKFNDDLIITEQHNASIREQIFGSQYGWLETKAPCDVLEVSGFNSDFSSISILTDETTYDPIKVSISDIIAEHFGIHIDMYYISKDELNKARKKTISDYHTELRESCNASVESYIMTEKELLDLNADTKDTSLVIVSADNTKRSMSLLNTSINKSDSIEDSIVVYGESYNKRLVDKIADKLF